MLPGRVGRGLKEQSGCTGPKIQSPERKKRREEKGPSSTASSNVGSSYTAFGLLLRPQDHNIFNIYNFS